MSGYGTKRTFQPSPSMSASGVQHLEMAPLNCGMRVSAQISKVQTDFGCILHTCRILSCAKCSRVRELTKCRFHPHRHSTANVSSAVRVFGLRTAVLSNPSACVWLAAQRTTTESNSHTEQTDSRRTSNNEAVLTYTKKRSPAEAGRRRENLFADL